MTRDREIALKDEKCFYKGCLKMCEGWLWRNEQQLIYWEINEDYTLRTQSFLQKEKKSITWNDLNLLGLHMTILCTTQVVCQKQ